MTGADETEGFRLAPAGGPRLRADIVDVYVFRRASAGGGAGRVELLQLLRAAEPLKGAWQPLMGHIEAGETAVECALREMREETGLSGGDPAVIGVWALEQVHPYYMPQIDCVVLGPRFAVEVETSWSPTLNAEHSEHRWVDARDVERLFYWPGQKAACAELLREIAPVDAPARQRRRISPR